MNRSIPFFFLLLFYHLGNPIEGSTARSTVFTDFLNQLNITFCPRLTGHLVFPGEPSYEQARLGFNYYPSKDKFPNLIVYAQNTRDVQNAIRWARCHKASIRIRSGGHSHEAFSTGTGVIIIDVSQMKQIQLDPSNNLVTVQAGVTNQELYNRLHQENLTPVGGICSGVSLAGLVLSGGMGPLLRQYGLACDHLVSLEMVDANGQIIHATPDNEYKDLFWASCGGGGGNFGVVTSLSLKVYPSQPVTWFSIGWDWNSPVKQLITAWQDFFSNADRRWYAYLNLWPKTFPSEKLKTAPISVFGVFSGSPKEAQQRLTPLLNIAPPHDQTIKLVPWEQAIKLIEESLSVFIGGKPEYKSTGAFAMNRLPPEAINIIYHTLQESPSPFLNIQLFTLGGAVQERSPTDTAYFYRQAKFFVNDLIEWLPNENAKQRIDELNTIRQRLLSYTEGNYVGNPDPNIKDHLKTYYGGNAHQLQCIKRKYDPSNVFSFEQSIPPAPILWNCPLNH